MLRRMAGEGYTVKRSRAWRGLQGGCRMPSMAKKALLILAAGVLLAGCGVRGTVQMPMADAKGAAAADTTGATAESGQGKAEGAAPGGHKGFILDGLLR